MMYTKRIWLVLVFVAVFGLSFAYGESVLKRVTAIEDPELGEMLRIALENMPEIQKLAEYERLSSSGSNDRRREFTEKLADVRVEVEQAKVETARIVSEIYSQVILLDEQIDTTMQMYKKASIGAKGELATELLLATAELKAERATSLAKLRAAMNIVPKFAFSTKPVKMLNSWIELCLVGDSIYVHKYAKPFSKRKSSNESDWIGKKSRNEIFELLRELGKDEKLLPMRVDISSMVDASGNLGELRQALVDVLKNAKVQVDAEVHVDRNLHRYYTTYYEVVENEILTGKSTRKRVIKKGRSTIETIREKITTDEIVGNVKWTTTRPWKLPWQYVLSYDEQSKEFAEKAKKAMLDAAKEKGVEELVTVKLKELKKEDDKKE